MRHYIATDHDILQMALQSAPDTENRYIKKEDMAPAIRCPLQRDLPENRKAHIMPPLFRRRHLAESYGPAKEPVSFRDTLTAQGER